MGTPAQLPDDVIVEILLCLPSHCIARCRAVCRAWRFAISHPSFERAHAERPAAVAKITTDLQRYVYGVEGPILLTRRLSRAVALELFRDDFRRALWFATPWYAFVLGSWDGVVCIERGNWPHRCIDFYVDHYVLWNPLTMACATVDTPDRLGHIIAGYAHPETRRFHLVQVSGETHGDLLISPTVFRIRRVGDAVWRELPLPGNISHTAELCMNTHVPRFVRLHGNLHWLVQPSGSGTLQLLALDMSREKFWSIGTPARQGGLAMARIGLVSGAGKLCIFGVLPSTSTMEMWVLNRYSGRPPGFWQLKESINLITLDRSDLSRTFLVTTEVEVVEGVREGQEIFLVQHAQGRIDAYNVRHKAWRMLTVSWNTSTRNVWVVMHRESALDGKVSFGEASQGLVYWVDNYGQRHFSCLS
ncbi:unnamed protein product [Alopecurus aequalis]